MMIDNRVTGQEWTINKKDSETLAKNVSRRSQLYND